MIKTIEVEIIRVEKQFDLTSMRLGSFYLIEYIDVPFCGNDLVGILIEKTKHCLKFKSIEETDKKIMVTINEFDDLRLTELELVSKRYPCDQTLDTDKIMCQIKTIEDLFNKK